MVDLDVISKEQDEREGTHHLDLISEETTTESEIIYDEYEEEEMKKLNLLATEAKKMITEMKNKSRCEACMEQVIKALSLIKDNHNSDVCARMKSWRCYDFHNQELENKIRKLLR